MTLAFDALRNLAKDSSVAPGMVKAGLSRARARARALSLSMYILYIGVIPVAVAAVVRAHGERGVGVGGGGVEGSEVDKFGPMSTMEAKKLKREEVLALFLLQRLSVVSRTHQHLIAASAPAALCDVFKGGGGGAGGRTEEEEDACLLLAGLALAPILGACPTSPDVPDRLWCAQCVLS